MIANAARDKIHSLVRRHRWAEFERTNVAEMDTITGYALAQSDHLILVARTDEFHLDGFQILRLADVSQILSGKNKDTIDRILKSEGVAEKATIPFELELTSWATALRSLRSHKKLITIDFELDREDTYLYIGEPLRINSRNVLFRWFDVHGAWEEDPLYLPYEEITSIRFDNEYATVFAKYLKEPS